MSSPYFAGPNRIVSKGHLVPPENPSTKWRPREVEKGSSFYLTLKSVTENHLDKNGDWEFMVDVISGDVLTAKEAFDLGER